MLHILLGITLLLPCSLAFPIHVADKSVHTWDEDDWKAYLDHFYPCFDDKGKHTVKERLEIMQEFFHLSKTGKPNAATLEVMHRPRCGVPDVLEYNTMPGNKKWEKGLVTYRLNNYTEDMYVKKIHKDIKEAFDMWAEHIPMSFQEVNKPADIEIWFSRGEHGDGNPFDGKGGTLAHAYAPDSDLGGDCHFDNDEKWSKIDQDINLLVVAAHEFGHSLGLDHSRDPNALMYPTYSYVAPVDFKLSPDDINGIQSIYGKKLKKPEESEEHENSEDDNSQEEHDPDESKESDPDPEDDENSEKQWSRGRKRFCFFFFCM